MTLKISTLTKIESASRNLSMVKNDTALISDRDISQTNFQLYVLIGGLFSFLLLMTINITLCCLIVKDCKRKRLTDEQYTQDKKSPKDSGTDISSDESSAKIATKRKSGRKKSSHKRKKSLSVPSKSKRDVETDYSDTESESEETQDSETQKSYHKSPEIKRIRNQILTTGNQFTPTTVSGSRLVPVRKTAKGKDTSLSYPQLGTTDRVVISQCVHSLSAVPYDGELYEHTTNQKEPDQHTEFDKEGHKSTNLHEGSHQHSNFSFRQQASSAEVAAPSQLFPLTPSTQQTTASREEVYDICDMCKRTLFPERGSAICEQPKSIADSVLPFSTTDQRVASQQERRFSNAQSIPLCAAHSNKVRVESSDWIPQSSVRNITNQSHIYSQPKLNDTAIKHSSEDMKSQKGYEAYRSQSTKLNDFTGRPSLENPKISSVEHSYVIPLFSHGKINEEPLNDQSRTSVRVVEDQAGSIKCLHKPCTDQRRVSDEPLYRTMEGDITTERSGLLHESQLETSDSVSRKISSDILPNEANESHSKETNERITLSIPVQKQSVPLTLILGQSASSVDKPQISRMTEEQIEISGHGKDHHSAESMAAPSQSSPMRRLAADSVSSEIHQNSNGHSLSSSTQSSNIASNIHELYPSTERIILSELISDKTHSRQTVNGSENQHFITDQRVSSGQLDGVPKSDENDYQTIYRSQSQWSKPLLASNATLSEEDRMHSIASLNRERLVPQQNVSTSPDNSLTDGYRTREAHRITRPNDEALKQCAILAREAQNVSLKKGFLPRTTGSSVRFADDVERYKLAKASSGSHAQNERASFQNNDISAPSTDSSPHKRTQPRISNTRTNEPFVEPRTISSPELLPPPRTKSTSFGVSSQQNIPSEDQIIRNALRMRRMRIHPSDSVLSSFEDMISETRLKHLETQHFPSKSSFNTELNSIQNKSTVSEPSLINWSAMDYHTNARLPSTPSTLRHVSPIQTSRVLSNIYPQPEKVHGPVVTQPPSLPVPPTRPNLSPSRPSVPPTPLLTLNQQNEIERMIQEQLHSAHLSPF